MGDYKTRHASWPLHTLWIIGFEEPLGEMLVGSAAIINSAPQLERAVLEQYDAREPGGAAPGCAGREGRGAQERLFALGAKFRSARVRAIGLPTCSRLRASSDRLECSRTRALAAHRATRDPAVACADALETRFFAIVQDASVRCENVEMSISRSGMLPNACRHLLECM